MGLFKDIGVFYSSASPIPQVIQIDSSLRNGRLLGPKMIKAVTPVVVLAVSVLFKLKQPSSRLFGTVGLISLGVAVASYGEIQVCF